MTAHSSPIDEFRTLLRRVRVLVGGDDVLLSQLGKYLRSLDPDFSAARFGERRLLDLLRRLPDVGRVERPASGADRFRFTGSRPDGPDGGEPDGPAEDWARVRLRRDVWLAVTSFAPPPTEWSFDLDALRFVRDDEIDPELRARQPERFLAIPDAGAAYQRDLARSWAAERDEDVQRAVGRALEEDDWLAHLAEALDEYRLADEWRHFRVRSVVRKALEWAARHGIRRDRLVALAPVRRGPSSRPNAMGGRDGSPADVRRALHALVDSLSDQEVLSFPVPAAFLPRIER